MGLRPNFTPFRLPVGAGTCGSLGDAAAFQLRGHAEHGALWSAAAAAGLLTSDRTAAGVPVKRPTHRVRL